LRRLVRLVSVVAASLALASAVPLVACSAEEDLTSASSSRADGGAGQAPAQDSPRASFDDAGAAPKGEAKRGLCGATNDCSPEPYDTCAPPPDASAPAATTQGCRVVNSSSGVSTQCAQADARGVDGTSCTKGADCAPGFDCVEGEKGPVCRRYCCSGSCGSQPSRNGGSTYCDIGKVARLDPYVIPVCMPVKACKLLHEADCSDKETCAVVSEAGVTSCVPRGDAKVGAPCDATHCDANLNCLGSPGDRHCYKLCRLDGNDCAPMETCTTGSVFQDTSFGVCKKD
jgi:hypothetical protein